MKARWWMVPAAVGGVMLGRKLANRVNGYDFAGKVVLITGGSRGLGLELARQLAKEGAKVAICARSADELNRAKAELEALGAEVFSYVCDVTEVDEVKALVVEVGARFGRLDVLINNAGVIQVGSLATMTEADFREAMAINFWGPLHTTLEALPLLRATHDGRIVNISSIGGKLPVPHLLPYSASKFALTGLSEGMRAELLDDGIRVTTVCPGLMRTGSPRNATFKGDNAAREYEWFSIGDSLPFVTMSAPTAARRILNACRRGQSEIVLSWPAKLASWSHGLFPGFTSAMLTVMNELLPRNGGARYSFLGRATGALNAHPFLTFLADKAALRNNEA